MGVQPAPLHGHPELGRLTSAGQLLGAAQRWREGAVSRGWNECGIHYWNLAAQRESLACSPEMGWGRGPPGGPGREPWGGGVRQSPFPPPQLSWGPCFLRLLPSPENAGGNHVGFPLPLRPCWREWPGPWPLPPTASCFAALASLHGGWDGRGPRPLPGHQPPSWE